MAKKVNEKKAGIINSIENKGDPIPITGTTQSGKSTAIGFMASSDDVRDLMSMREAQGKGSTIETNIVITDSDAIEEDELIVMATVAENHIASSGDDNEFMAEMLRSAVNKYMNNGDEDAYRNEVQRNIKVAIEEPANDSLAYKIKDLSEEQLYRLVDTLIALPKEKLVILYTEAKAICEQEYKQKSRYKAEKRIFREKLSDDVELIEYINEFWRCIIEILDAQSAKVLDLLKANGAYIDDDNTFVISLTRDDYDTELAKILLDSESESKEFLFSGMSLVFRGNSEYFSGGLSKYIAVSEQSGKEIHCLRLLDTMGLFHSEGVSADEESERIIDIIASNHSDKLLLVDNTHITDTVKDGNAAVKTLFQKLKWNISVYIIRTHWDESIEQEARQASIARRRSRMSSNVNWEQIYQQVKSRQDKMIETYRDCMLGSDKKGKANIVGVYNAALLLNDMSAKDEVLTRHSISYDCALAMFVQDVLQSIQKNGDKIRVREGIAEQCVINPDSRGWDVKSLYRNMVVDCKGHKYWAPSVRAVCHKWMTEGMKHDSDIKENDYGYMNIHTNFVIDMRNLAMGVLKNSKAVELNIDDYIVGDVEKEQVRKEMMQYITDGQALGKEFAKIIGEKSFEYGFKKNIGFCYQYQRLNDMLQYTQDHFFQSEKIVLNDDISEMLLDNMREALHRCIKNYVNAKCVEVC